MFGRFLAAALAALFACSPAFALSPAQQAILFAKKPTAAASYVGPGDVVAMTFWVGMRAYSAATRGTKAVNICSETGGVDVTCEDELTSAATGKLVLGTVGATCGSITCTVKTFYDQTGNNFCSSAACNFTQTTVANRAAFNISCPTISYPCAVFTQASSDSYAAGGTVLSSHNNYTVSTVFQNIYTSTQNVLFSDQQEIQFAVNPGAAANELYMYDGVEITATANDGSWHAVQCLFDDNVTNGSFMYVDGTGGTPGTMSGGKPLEAPFVIGMLVGGGNYISAYFEELGAADGVTFTGAQNSNMNSNQHTFYGF